MDLQGENTDKKLGQNRVKVAIRVRPFISRQIAAQERNCFQFPSQKQIIIGSESCYKFDRVFNQNNSQQEVYQQCVKGLMLGCFEGYNAAVLAYGQTGSGKSYTMGTHAMNIGSNLEGILPRVINDIYNEIEKKNNFAQFNVRASFIQIYNEQIIDLLEGHKGIKMKENSTISIREQKDGSVSLSGVTEQLVKDASQMLSLLERGSINRTTAVTLMNDSSSRSHAIFSLHIEQHIIAQPDQGYITAKFFFVDLAGSERLKKTGATGVTLKQGISINLGLLELGNVISALATQKKQSQFISFRNSKLTRILQDSLGGNSNTYMIACVSPSESNYQESLNTIKYASKAMNIKNKPVVNRDPHTAFVNQLKQKINQLQNENFSLKQLLKGQGVDYQLITSHKNQNQKEIQKKRVEISILQRKNEKLYIDLKQEKKRRNQLDIKNYDIQRQKDILISLLQKFKTNHPEFQIEADQLQSKQNIPLIQNYLNRIQQLQADLFQKDKVISQLQIQYSRIHQLCEKNQQLLLKKNQTIYKLVKQNKDSKIVIENIKKQIIKQNGFQENANEEEESEDLSVIEQLNQEESMVVDEEYNEHADAFYKREEKVQTQIKTVQQCIYEKEKILQEMSQDQMDLEMELLLQMKQKYHRKINEIQLQKNQLIKQQKTEFNQQTTNKLAQKIENLEVQLRDYRNKAKQQKHLEIKLQQQSNQIKNLGNQIKSFQIQKIELTRKLKQDKDIFYKFKNKRTQQLLLAKKQNAKKEIRIRKLSNQNKKNAYKALKNQDQIKRVKKINETLKILMKPLKKMRRVTQKYQKNENILQKQEKVKIEFQNIVQECINNLLLKIDRDFDLQKYWKKCQEINAQLDVLVKQQSKNVLKLQQMNLFQLQEIEDNNEQENLVNKLKIDLEEVRERIANLQDNLQFCQRKYHQILADQNQNYCYEYESKIIFNPAYDNCNSLREILKAFIQALNKLLVQNYKIKIEKEDLNLINSSLSGQISQLKENVVRMNAQYQQNLSHLRNELLLKEYESQNQDEINDNISYRGNNLNHCVQNKNESKEKKILEKKVLQLTKNVSRLNLQIETWRRKCIIIQEKYQSMKALFNKDKYIGRPNREEENNINHPNNPNRDNKKANFQQGNGQINLKINENENIIQELDMMTEQLRSVRVRRNKIYEEMFQQDKGQETLIIGKRRQYNNFKWQCVTSIQAHTSPVLCLKNDRNVLVSSANRSIRLWDLADNKLVSEIINQNINTFVKSIAICKEKRMLVAACDKVVTLWDLRQSSNQGVLRGHKEEVRCLHIANNYLFTAGKGLSNSGSLFIWDIRYLNSANPLEEKEKNQDIFSMTSFKNILYFGSRDHHVRRLNTETLQSLTPFQPPHMDTVTSLAISQNHLISGSKDKNLRLWALDHSIYNLKSTVHASNDYINTVETDIYHPIFYAGDRTGQIKVGTINKQKIEFLGSFTHTQAVNSICSLEMSRGVATGSTDKTIKIWKPTKQTQMKIGDNLF